MASDLNQHFPMVDLEVYQRFTDDESSRTKEALWSVYQLDLEIPWTSRNILVLSCNNLFIMIDSDVCGGYVFCCSQLERPHCPQIRWNSCDMSNIRVKTDDHSLLWGNMREPPQMWIWCFVLVKGPKSTGSTHIETLLKFTSVHRGPSINSQTSPEPMVSSSKTIVDQGWTSL